MLRAVQRELVWFVVDPRCAQARRLKSSVGLSDITKQRADLSTLHQLPLTCVNVLRQQAEPRPLHG